MLPAGRCRYAAAVTLLGCLLSAEAPAQTGRTEIAALGSVARVQGEATLLRNARAMPVTVGQPVTRGDTLRTAEDSRLLLTFSDGTQLTLGERAEAFIDSFVYNPLRRSGAAVVDVIKGAFRFSTGRIRDFRDKRIEVRTRSATLAADGSDFWGGPIDDSYGVLLIEGRVEVRNEAGMVLMQQKRLGSIIAAPSAAPGMPVRWNKARIGRAFDTVSFK